MALVATTLVLLSALVRIGYEKLAQRRTRSGPPLLNEAGQAARRFLTAAAAFGPVYAALMTALSAAIAVVLLPTELIGFLATQTLLAVFLISLTTVVVVALCFGAFQHGRRCRAARLRVRVLRQVAAKLSGVDADLCRVFHDVRIQTDTKTIDHVLVSVRGTYAITTITDPNVGDATRLGDRLHIGKRTIALSDIRARCQRLQHELSKPLGKMIRLRPVLAVPGAALRAGEVDGLLITGLDDIVMLQGWRDSGDHLMIEEVRALIDDLTARASG
ncbi:MAG: nuclease-related domain-containing protein [Pseudomonadota bacterium]